MQAFGFRVETSASNKHGPPCSTFYVLTDWIENHSFCFVFRENFMNSSLILIRITYNKHRLRGRGRVCGFSRRKKKLKQKSLCIRGRCYLSTNCCTPHRRNAKYLTQKWLSFPRVHKPETAPRAVQIHARDGRRAGDLPILFFFFFPFGFR